ncbi:MAG: nucleoside triphosphate pyrophosphohydrolase family protein [Methyloglobulus sp.]|nr:nucleoside triphosphate pyrophosphohydrolase family protein [Methyloglobulus sp.]
MKFDDYQRKASETDIVQSDIDKKFYVPLTGLIGEIGSLIAEYKKYLRDGKAYENFTDHMQEEIGDVLWYVATLARRQDLSLSKIAEHILMLRTPYPLPLLGFEDNKKAFDEIYAEENLDRFQVKAAQIQRFDAEEEINLFAALMETSNKAGELIDQSIHVKNTNDLKTIMMIGLGSILWQLSYIASIRKIKLSDVAKYNLDKIISRWPGDHAVHTPLFDEEYPEHEQFPRYIEIVFKGFKKPDGADFTIVSCNCIQIGDRLTDNTYDDTGYRFHDAIHYAFMAVLGWSPIMRRLFKVKRKSDPKKDEVDDGARAGIIEEAIVSLTYDYARDQGMLEGQDEIDHSRIKMIQKLSRGLEVETCKPWEWRIAILKGYEMFRKLRDNKGGILILDLNKRNIEYRTL